MYLVAERAPPLTSARVAEGITAGVTKGCCVGRTVAGGDSVGWVESGRVGGVGLGWWGWCGVGWGWWEWVGWVGLVRIVWVGLGAVGAVGGGVPTISTSHLTPHNQALTSGSGERGGGRSDSPRPTEHCVKLIHALTTYSETSLHPSYIRRTSVVHPSYTRRTICIQYRTAVVQVDHRASYIVHRTSYTVHRTSYIVHRVSCVAYGSRGLISRKLGGLLVSECRHEARGTKHQRPLKSQVWSGMT